MPQNMKRSRPGKKLRTADFCEESFYKELFGRGKRIFNVYCATANGKIMKKREEGNKSYTWDYEYDSPGHLLAAWRDDVLMECYAYDELGRRVKDYRAQTGENREFIYDGHELIKAGNLEFQYDNAGRVSAIVRPSGIIKLKYGDYGRLVEAVLPRGWHVYYQYDGGLMPARIMLGDRTAFEYSWERYTHLTRCVDHTNGLTFEFQYYKGYYAPVKVEIHGEEERVKRITGVFPLGSLQLRIGEDQVNSIRALGTGDDFAIKNIEYDSFGNVLCETAPDFRFPLGFACGLKDDP